MDQIAADPKAALEEKRKMMDMLRRLEEQDLGEANVLEDEDEDEDDLVNKLQNVDIGERYPVWR